MVPINKQSKKNKKKYNSLKRITWGVCNPATRIHKTVNRRDARNKERGKAE